MGDDAWDLVDAERLALADFLTALSPDEWSTPSLCGEWSVLRAIREAAARRLHEDRVRELSSAARSRYADVLERLGR